MSTTREQQEGTGVLFKNERKRPDRQDPDYQGRMKVNGEERWLSAWINRAQSTGVTYMSIKLGAVVQPKLPETDSQPATAPTKPTDIPF